LNNARVESIQNKNDAMSQIDFFISIIY